MALMPEDVVNNALDVMGYPKRIASFVEGSQAAIAARDIWQETVDEALALQPWSFARIFLALDPDEVPTSGGVWTYRWERPDVITVLDVFSGGLDRDNPIPGLWMEYRQTGVPTGGERRILTNFNYAQAVGVERVLNTGLWSPEFTGVIVQMLAQKLGRLLIGGEDGPGRRGEQRTGRDRASDQDQRVLGR